MKHTGKTLLRRVGALLLCAAMVCGLLAGCANAKKTTEFDKLYQHFKADDVVATVDGTAIRWDVYANALYSAFATLEGNYGQIPDWSREVYEGCTYSQFVKEYALYNCRYYAVIENKAREAGIVYDAAGEAEVQEIWETYASSYESEDAFLDSLAESYCSADVYRYILKSQYLYKELLEKTYGEHGELLTEQQIQDYIDSKGFQMAKIIAILGYNAETGTAYDDVEKARRLAIARSIVHQLDEYTGDDLPGYFEELRAQYNEDPAAKYFPDGYLFTESDLGSVVYSACSKLEEYGYSQAVSSDYAYYVILRLPIDRAATPLEKSNYVYYEMDYTLVDAAADALLAADAATWEEASEITPSKEYEELNLGDWFTKAVTIETDTTASGSAAGSSSAAK